jgi:hypothetical protein
MTKAVPRPALSVWHFDNEVSDFFFGVTDEVGVTDRNASCGGKLIKISGRQYR